MRVVIAPDKFKGSLQATEVAEAVAKGVREAVPEARPVCVPMADGGEGTVDSAVVSGHDRQRSVVTGPTGTPVEATWALGHTEDGRLEAVLEMAEASGIAALPTDDAGRPRLDATGATSLGTGELVRAALDAGARRVVLGVGGSACTDGGAGMLVALGARILDATATQVPRGGLALAEATSVDLSGLDPRLASTEMVLAADVDNPLTGPRGAAAVFAPQKGADERQVTALDEALTRWSDVLAEAAPTAPTECRLEPHAIREAASSPGAGAAGGVGFAAVAVLGATHRRGVEVVLEFTHLAETIAGPERASLVITGEGSLDEQSLRGKTPMGVAACARSAGVPVAAICGHSTLSEQHLQEAGFVAVRALTDIDPDPSVCMQEAARLLPRAAAELLGDLPEHTVA